MLPPTAEDLLVLGRVAFDEVEDRGPSSVKDLLSLKLAPFKEVEGHALCLPAEDLSVYGRLPIETFEGRGLSSAVEDLLVLRRAPFERCERPALSLAVDDLVVFVLVPFERCEDRGGIFASSSGRVGMMGLLAASEPMNGNGGPCAEEVFLMNFRAGERSSSSEMTMGALCELSDMAGLLAIGSG